MTDPDYIITISVLSGDGKTKLLEWQVGGSVDDQYVAEYRENGHPEAVSVALAQIHTYDLMAQRPTYISPELPGDDE